jgi:eukaryotic-like serine/threonine-protein kinase
LANIPLDIPDRIGRYELLSLIGVGGYARVYKARLRGPMGFAKLVALKVTSAPEAEESKQVKALINEARICGRMQHPNIIEIYEFGRFEDQYFIAMEYIDGVPLDQVIETVYAGTDRLHPALCLEVMGQVCQGLRYAHNLVDEDGSEHQVIHRDLKPGNLMLSQGGQVKIMDFGIAKSALNVTQTMEGFTKGTPMYMSPEQVHGEDLTPASDIFTLGIVLFEMITGKRLFAALNLLDVIEKIAHADVEDDLRASAATLGPLLRTLRSALARDPADRISSAGVLMEALFEARATYPPGPTIASLVEDVRGHDLPGDAVPPPPTLPASGEVTQHSGSHSWSVVLPALSSEIPTQEGVLTSLSGDEQITVSLELVALPPLKGAED